MSDENIRRIVHNELMVLGLVKQKDLDALRAEEAEAAEVPVVVAATSPMADDTLPHGVMPAPEAAAPAEAKAAKAAKE